MSPEELLEVTLERARAVPVGGRVDPAEVTRKAIERARLEARVRRARRGRFLAGVAAAVVLLALAWGTWAVALRSSGTVQATVVPKVFDEVQGPERARVEGSAEEASSSAEPRRLRLGTGDLLVSTPAVRFEVLSEELDRVVRLDDGEMLFDVAHRPSGSFVVRASDYSVMVLGTVFSVRREHDAVGVCVFEGLVLVRAPDGTVLQRLSAGDIWVSERLEGMDAWRARSEREWRRIAAEGLREEGRAAPAVANSGLALRADGVDGPGPAGEGQGLAGTGPSGDRDPDAPALADARAMLAQGDFEAALSMSEGRAEAGWLLVRADALRGLGRTDAAAQAYEGAARLLHENRRVGAAFAAAQLRAETAPEAALRLLERFDVTSRSSPLEERARALQIQLLYRIGRTEEADREALVYEERFGSPR